jgi:hypothetical protein
MHMKKLITALSGLALMLVLGTANADEAKGVIKQIDTAVGSLTLADGSQYILSEDVSTEGLQAGDEVTVSYEMISGKKLANEVTKAKN